MKNRRITVTLTDEEQDFIKRLAKQDGITEQEEMQVLFICQLREEMELHEELTT